MRPASFGFLIGGKHSKPLLLILLAQGLISCGRKEEASVPNLSAPAPAFKTAVATPPEEKPKAAAEATGTMSPVQLTLRLYKTKVKAGLKPLWYQLELKNVGPKKFQLSEGVFFGPWNMEYLRKSSQRPNSIYVEVRRQDGAVFPGQARASLRPDCLPKKERESFESLRENAPTAVKMAEPEEHDDSAIHWLMPGASTRTAAWASRDQCDERDGVAPRRPVGDFAELSGLALASPGKYRIRAVYGRDERKALGGYRELVRRNIIDPKKLPPPSRSNEEHHVLVETPFIELEVY